MRSFAVAVLLLSFVASDVSAAEPPTWMIDLVPNGVNELARQKRVLISAKRSRTTNPAAKRAEIEAIQAKIDSPGPGKIEQATVGSAGIPWEEQLGIIQVVSADSALVKLIGIGVEKTLLLSLNTAGLTDDTTVKFDHPILITGTKTYPTAVGGSNTVLTARLWTEAEKDQFAELVLKAAKKR